MKKKSNQPRVIQRAADIAEWAFRVPPRDMVRVSILVSFPQSAPSLGRRVHTQQLYTLDFIHDAEPAALVSVLAEPILAAIKEWEKANEQGDS